MRVSTIIGARRQQRHHQSDEIKRRQKISSVARGASEGGSVWQRINHVA